MKKLLTLVLLFIAALYVGVKVNHRNNFELLEDESEFEIHADGPSEFIKYHQGIRTRSDEKKPSYPDNYLLTELRKATLFASKKNSNQSPVTESNPNGVSAFTERGPGNVPGRTRGIIVDPDDSSHKTWYVGSAGGGVWKTNDAGTSWQWLTPNVPNMATTCLAMAESDHNVIYAGTGEGFGLVDGISGMGIFKSDDRGATWNVLASSSVMENINRIVINPSDKTKVVAACNKGIYQSNDGGATWNKVYSGVVQDLRATPGNFSIMYGGQNGLGVIKSIDNGATWSLANKGMSPKGRVEIAISPVNPNRLVASTEGTLSGKNSDLYVSDDGAKTWYLVTLTNSSKTVDYLSTQGWYDNTVAFSPYNKDVVYMGGVSAFQATLGAPVSGTTGAYSINEINTVFISLVNFNASQYGGKLEIGSAVTHDTVEVRFGPGLKQKAHRFWVPDGRTSGVLDAEYTYKDYVNVPFQVWNRNTNQQLMVSFRDQGRDGFFNLIHQNTDSSWLLQSREYLFINNVPYSTTPNPSIAQAGGQKYNEMYFFWPTLANSATWDSTALPASKLQIKYMGVNSYSSTVKTVSDSYNDYDKINNYAYVHPDQHNIVPIKIDDASQTFQLLLANDGGVFLSKSSTSPGTTQGDWTKVGYGYNTSQFYGADKKPGAEEYFGGMQDNSTWFTPRGTIASSSTYYSTSPQLAGDGFEVLWNSFDGKKMIGGSQYNNFSLSVDGGTTWVSATAGLPGSGGIPDHSVFPFISKLANSKQAPDNIYTVGSKGVWRSTNFGVTWTLTPINDPGWGGNDSFIDVEVSRAKPTIVWAGPGQYSGGNLFVSTDAGVSFSPVPNPPGIILGSISRLATHPWEPNTAYAIYSFANTAKILKTTDLGQTWTDISGFGTGTSSSNGFPDVAVYCLYVRTDNPNILWAGTEIGIVESLDGGSSWALLNTFPNVAVWDMKGQDNEIVIATHGRGIWTATLNNDQNAFSKIVQSGTSPQSDFKIKLHVPVAYDSVIIKVGSTGKVKFLPPDSGTYILQISNIPTGWNRMQTFSYIGNVTVPSPPVGGYNLKLSDYRQSFFDYFIDSTNFHLSGLNIRDFGISNTSLQTKHNYSANQNNTGTLLVPIIVSSGVNTSIIYDDVAIVQPGANGSVFGQKSFNDYVIAEATKDGLTWTPIANGYNASAQPSWLSAFNSKSSGNSSMTVTESFNLKNNFNVNDTILVRFRLFSNTDTQIAWGWSVDNLYIQQTPTAIESSMDQVPIAYPNSSTGKFTIAYALKRSSNVSVTVWDITGRSVRDQSFGTQQEGKNEVELNLEALNTGVYIARLRTSDGDHTFKLIINR